MLILVTGAAASGKSAYAEQRALDTGAPLVYVATMKVRGDEDRRRVQRHRALREGKGFATLEIAQASELERAAQKLSGQSTVLLEDLANLTSDALFDEQGDMRKVPRARSELLRSLRCLAKRAANLIVVGNEVGAGLAPKTREVRTYIDLLGSISCEYAAMCDEVFEVVCTVPVRIK